MTKHIFLRGPVYYARLDIPKNLREHLGKTSFIQSLKTRDKRIAEIRAYQLLGEWKLEIEAARGSSSALFEARWLRTKIQNSEDYALVDACKEYAADRASQIEDSGKVVPMPDGDYRTTTTEEAQRYYKVATGAYTPISDYATTWLEEIDVKPKTLAEYQRAIKDLTSHFDFVEQVDRKSAANFVRTVLQVGRSAQTVNKKLSAYLGFWKWLERLGLINENVINPWTNQRPSTGRNKVVSVERRPLSEAEASALLLSLKKVTNKNPDDFAVSLLMAATGLRLSEAANLKVKDCVDKNGVLWVSITEAKTKAGIRSIPVVPAEVSTEIHNRLVSKDPELFIFPTLGEQSPALSKRLNLKLRQICEDKEVVAAHSWRHRARTLAEHGGIEPWVADSYFGHKREGEGLGRYSKRSSDEQLLACAQAIQLPTLQVDE
ncbi:hypothetical protein E1162_09320 [Rhodobacteraceae bacterium RKSG542]|uniref:DUF6538 domain-containing protein n=1 Tax=Pseudovibrio flavus TaxID=2529854 RepID=UPI0012BBA513|nr:DUF6538 domain-containing protein [Pseudovibrio flavus]MTI17438.1 hypothetical protein [Pseudovibrio flavus]